MSESIGFQDLVHCLVFWTECISENKSVFCLWRNTVSAGNKTTYHSWKCHQ